MEIKEQIHQVALELKDTMYDLKVRSLNQEIERLKSKIEDFEKYTVNIVLIKGLEKEISLLKNEKQELIKWLKKEIKLLEQDNKDQYNLQIIIGNNNFISLFNLVLNKLEGKE